MSASNASIGRQQGTRGPLTRRVLETLRSPGGVPDLKQELGLAHEDAWSLVKHLHEQGRLERVSRGVYRITPAGEAALVTPNPESVKLLRTSARKPPEGKGWTAERVAWLTAHYPRLGHKRCAELLGTTPTAVHAKAAKLGLRFGEVDGYQLLNDLASLLGFEYRNLIVRAQRAGVLTFPGTVKDQQRRSKAMVPEWWAEQIADERQPPEPNDVSLETLRRELQLGKTQMVRKAGADARLRTPVTGGQAQLYVSVDAADRLRAEYRERRKVPRPPVVGRAGFLAAIEARGPEGATERELFESGPSSRAAVRLHVRALLRDGLLQRCRLGDSLDPFVYRLVQYTGQPQPSRRNVVIPGRPRKTSIPQAAD
ncbi:hypothetical protein [Deinococcus navajonensis]|uniref:Uncharacterized protein n=1 Tax=Deinococcus navajonensis TaxID=309884 RepID=A0ABV8XNS3_9DEIO